MTEVKSALDQLILPHSTYFVKQLKVKFSFFKNYTYLIVDKVSKHAAIIDPAWEFETIVKTIEELNVRLTTILLTHSHVDHVNMVQPLLNRFNLQVFMSSEEIRFYNFTCERLNPVQNFDTIYLGQTPISCLLTPGHTFGGLSFLLSDSFFTGDTVFIEGCGICHAQGGSPEELFDSIQKIKRDVPSHVRIYPGHSFGKEPGYTLHHLMDENIYFQIGWKKQFVDFRMRKGPNHFFDFQ